VAAALVVFFQNYPPQPKDAAGTIGAAQRYHETQITGADVKVSQDAVTTWIQSETFDRIVKDPQARRLFTDAAVQDMILAAGRKFADGDSVKVGRVLSPDAAGGQGTRMIAPDTLPDAAGGQGTRIAPPDALLDQAGGQGTRIAPPDALLDASRKLNLGLAKEEVTDGMLKIARDNVNIRALLDNAAFVEALSRDGVLREGLVQYARNLDLTGEPQ